MNLEGKGKRLQNCNVTHCQGTNGVFFRNAAMRNAYYCRGCAIKIRSAADTEEQANQIFPDFEKNMSEYSEWRLNGRKY